MDERGFSGGAGRSEYADLDEHGVLLTDPDAIDRQARSLAGMAESMRTTRRLLQDLSVAGTWVSASGRAFGDAIDDVPSTLGQVAERFDDIADLISGHASALRDHIDELDRLGARYAASGREADIALRQAETATPGPELDQLNLRYDTLHDDNTADRKAFQDEAQRAVAADIRLGERLDDDVAHDLDDPWHYTALDGVESVGTWCDDLPGVVGWIPGLKGPEAAGSTVGFAATVGKKVAYGEGPRWGEIAATGRDKAVNSAAKYLGPLGRKVAKMPKRAASPAGARDIWAKHRNPALRSRRRTGSTPHKPKGVRARVRHEAGLTPRRARAAVEKQTGVTVVREMRADWRAVAGAGPTAKGLVIGGNTAKTYTFVDEKKKQLDSVRAKVEEGREPARP